jgi:hypothetical protein
MAAVGGLYCVLEPEFELELLVELAAAGLTCWTNGSLLAKWLKAKSCAFPALGSVSEFGSFELVTGMTAAAAPAGVVVGAAVVGAAAEVLGVVATACAGAAELLPPWLSILAPEGEDDGEHDREPTATFFIFCPWPAGGPAVSSCGS